MLYVCVRGVIDVFLIVTRGEVLVYGKYECFVTHMLYVCVLCAYCGSSQCCILHDLYSSLSSIFVLPIFHLLIPLIPFIQTPYTSFHLLSNYTPQ